MAALRDLAPLVLDPRHFLLEENVSLQPAHEPARIQRWEIFHGRLLDPAHTRIERSFEEWNLYRIEAGVRSDEPLLSLKLDEEIGKLHIVRAILCHAWEGYDSGGGVYLSRESTRWVRELCGTVTLAEFNRAEELLDELVSRVFHAVIGASRLPLTSVEAPLPDFSLGRLGYRFQTGEPNRLERIKELETWLRRPAPDAGERSVSLFRGRGGLSLLREVFNEAALSPWTGLVENSLLLVDRLEREKEVSAEEVIDLLADLTLKVTRHLTAYDLVTFHHRGANYPDALFLDALLKTLLRRVEREPGLFLCEGHRRRRSALRQGWLLRRSHEGLPIPDAPTSPGENLRFLPPPHVRVPEEQILNPAKRNRVLHEGDPLTLSRFAEQALRKSVAELSHPEEMLELGLALFLDRPLGMGKLPGEPDQTILLSHRAFSRALARSRIAFLLGKLDGISATDLEVALARMEVRGVSLSTLSAAPRAGTVSVADARLVSTDFVFLRTSRATILELFRQYDFSALWDWTALSDLKEVKEGRQVLIVPLVESGALTIHDAQMRPRIVLVPDTEAGFVCRAGREVVRKGLRAIVVGEGTVVTLPPHIAT